MNIRWLFILTLSVILTACGGESSTGPEKSFDKSELGEVTLGNTETGNPVNSEEKHVLSPIDTAQENKPSAFTEDHGPYSDMSPTDVAQALKPANFVEDNGPYADMSPTDVDEALDPNHCMFNGTELTYGVESNYTDPAYWEVGRNTCKDLAVGIGEVLTNYTNGQGQEVLEYKSVISDVLVYVGPYSHSVYTPIANATLRSNARQYLELEIAFNPMRPGLLIYYSDHVRGEGFDPFSYTRLQQWMNTPYHVERFEPINQLMLTHLNHDTQRMADKFKSI
ncbi:hypothetical protein [Vibrio comitans]|uniref:Lipoprotein n=1 Tax=Vibrio comitans NBRC 102076 TaxID=1219078 RepID=A0A4Y3IRJ4_9VIBR|nr:hypothetical protein [Vibrio comitans]GEA62123.1 hypothetical protein VCO01S_33160 [Vibrio comitans NBRC 102076]